MDKSSITAMEWHVRKALPEELPMIAEIEKLSFNRPWNLESIESFYYRKTSDIYVWRDRNRISGYIISEHVLDQAEIHRIAIIPFIRKMGIGTLLFREFQKRYRAIGVETIYLEVRESNEAAYKFYIKNGFEEYGRRAKYYKDPIEDAVLLFWDAAANDQTFPLDSSKTSAYNEEHKEENEMKCNVCGQLLRDKSDYIEVKKEWGYFSGKDTQIHEFKICERCYDRIVKQFEIPPKVTEKNEILS